MTTTMLFFYVIFCVCRVNNLYCVGTPHLDLSLVVQNFSVISWYDAVMMEKPLQMKWIGFCLCVGMV